MVKFGSIVVVPLVVIACGATRTAPPSRAAGGRDGPRAATTAPAPASTSGPASTTAPASTGVVRPTGKLRVPEARRYMLALLNRDRATAGLPPLALDEGPPTKAGQRHAEDMARRGFLGHWGTDGSVPEQRHTEAGGADMVLENALCFVDEKARTLDPDPLVDPEAIERAESQFFDEVPPNDGHRRNILRPGHTHVGIGIAQPVATPTELPVPCFAQELTDAYGTYAALPRSAKVGAPVHVEGTLRGPARPVGIGIARAPLPQPLSPAEANKRRSYPVPAPYRTYWGPGFVTPIPVKIDGQHFAVDVPLDDARKPGLYEVSVWAKLGDAPANVMVSLRTVRVE